MALQARNGTPMSRKSPASNSPATTPKIMMIHRKSDNSHLSVPSRETIQLLAKPGTSPSASASDIEVVSQL